MVKTPALKSDVFEEDKNEVPVATSKSWTVFKKSKSNDSKAKKFSNKTKRRSTSSSKKNVRMSDNDEDDEDEGKEIAKYFEYVRKGILQSLNTEKLRLMQFTDSIISLYKKNAVAMIKLQDEEFETFKKKTATNLLIGLNKWEEKAKKLRFQEDKLMKIFDDQQKILMKASKAEKDHVKKFVGWRDELIQGYHELTVKHKFEALILMKNLNAAASVLQNEYIEEVQKQDMLTMTLYSDSLID